MLTVIVGKSASGKSTLARKLKAENPDASLYLTDDYIPYGFKDSMYALMQDLIKDPNTNKIVEGVMVPRLLRKGLETGLLRADKIIVTWANESKRQARHNERGSSMESVIRRKSFDETVLTILAEYLGKEQNKPIVEYYET